MTTPLLIVCLSLFLQFLSPSRIVIRSLRSPILLFLIQEGLINIDISDNSTNNFLLELPNFESFHFDPSFPRPPPEPSDVEILEPEINNFDVLNNDEPFDPREGENVVFLNVEEDDSFTFTDYPDFEDSRAHGFVHLFELHILSFIQGIQYPNLIDYRLSLAYLINGFRFA
ncbi:hypothetical protein Tco_1506360 [Tanacetum coccineum]